MHVGSGEVVVVRQNGIPPAIHFRIESVDMGHELQSESHDVRLDVGSEPRDDVCFVQRHYPTFPTAARN